MTLGKARARHWVDGSNDFAASHISHGEVGAVLAKARLGARRQAADVRVPGLLFDLVGCVLAVAVEDWRGRPLLQSGGGLRLVVCCGCGMRCHVALHRLRLVRRWSKYSASLNKIKNYL